VCESIYYRAEDKGSAGHDYCAPNGAIYSHDFKREGGHKPMAYDHDILTMKEMCDLLHVHPSTVYKLVREGELPAFRIGSDWRFRTDTILRWMAEKSDASSRKNKSIKRE
jgi:excisionase family DNA binding protein